MHHGDARSKPRVPPRGARASAAGRELHPHRYDEPNILHLPASEQVGAGLLRALNARFGTHVLAGGDPSLFVNNLTNSHPDLALIRGGAVGGMGRQRLEPCRGT